MSSEADVWAIDDDPWYGAIETELYSLGSSYLQNVHRDIHSALELPPLPAHEVREAYQTPHLAKATSRAGAWSKAARAFQSALDKRERFGYLHPWLYRDLADAASNKWYSEGKLATRASRQNVASYLLGAMRAGKTWGHEPATLLIDYQGLLGEHDAARLDYAAASGAEHITNLDSQARHAVLSEVYAWEVSKTQPEELGQRLLKRFSGLNRDWRRTALTETALNRNNGYLASLPDGARVRWSAAKDACSLCRKLHNQHFKVVSPSKENKDGKAEVWVGKTTRGHRPLDWPAIPLHPHCRCRWIAIIVDDAVRPGVTPEVEATAQRLIAAARQP